jgi:hypothetical protein
MLRKILLPAFAIATLAGCATGYSYRGGNGDYYYGQPSVEYRFYGGYGYSGFGSYGYGQGFYVDIFGRPVYGYPYGYYGGRYSGYPYWHGPRPRPPHGPGHGGGHGHDDDHDDPPTQGGHRPGKRPPWRDIGRIHERGDGDGEQMRPRRLGQPDARPMVQRPAPSARPPAPVMRERSAPARSGGMERGRGAGERVRSVRPSASE